jgi:hypothetical protein
MTQRRGITTANGKVDAHGREGESRSLSLEVIFETLSNRRRRCTLYYLRHVDGPVSIRELSEQLAAWEHGVEREQVTPKERKRLYTALHQTHLPKMDRLDIVEYDKNRGTVSLTDAIDAFDSYLGPDDPGRFPWSRLNLALGGLMFPLVLLAGYGVEPLSWFASYGYALLATVLFTVVAAGEGISRLRWIQQCFGEPEADPVAVPAELVE